MSNSEEEMLDSFEEELVNSAALRGLCVLYGMQRVYLSWQIGWAVGVETGLKKAQEVLKNDS